VAALGGAHRAPRAFEGPARRGYRVIDVDLIAFRDRCDDLFGGGVEGVEGAPRGGRTRRPSINNR
jgi:hypothetical protein